MAIRDFRARPGAVTSRVLDTLAQNALAHIRVFYVTSSADQLVHALQKLQLQECVLHAI
jgi:hypothetical protein